MTGERAREQEIQEQELQNYKLGSWLNDECYKSKLLDFTAYEHCHLIIKFLDVPSTETAQPY